MSAPPTSEQVSRWTDAQAAGPDLFFALNTRSGASEGDEKRRLIAAALEGSGRRHSFVEVPPGGTILDACRHAAEQASAAGGVLVAVGGDGTVNCGAQAALTHGCPLGVVPMGTFNLFAREHGIPQDAGEAVRALLAARPQPVQAGLVNQRVFLVNAAVGLYPKLLEDREALKEQLGKRRRWIALAAALRSLLEWHSQLRLDAEVDGEVTRLRTPSLFVCNNRVQLRRVGVDEHVSELVGRGYLAGILTARIDVWGKLRLLWRALFSRLGAAPEIDSIGLRSLTLSTRSARKLKVAVDGEVTWMQLPVRFSVSPQPLLLMVPPPELKAPVE